MTFSAPIPWWWLLLLPVLWWLARPAPPRAQVLTPHFAQWQAALAALRRHPVRANTARLWLLILALVAVVVAAGRPFLPGGEGARRLVVVLDGSASMAARVPDGGSAWERAQVSLRDALSAVPPHVDVTVLRAGGPLLRRHGASARALQDLGAPNGSLGLDLEALAVAAVAVPHTAVWTLTDGQGQTALPTVGALTRFDTRGDNASLLAVRLVDRWPLPELGIEADVALHGAGPARVRVRVEGAVAGSLQAELELAPRATSTASFTAARTAAGGELRVVVELPGDVLAADDAWTALLPPLPTPRLCWLADAQAGPFAAVAASALAAEVGGTVVPPGAAEVGFLLVDGGRAALVPGQARALVFGSATPGSGDVFAWPSPTVVDWDRTGPLTAGLDLSELRVQQAWRGVLPAGTPFLWADDGAGREPLAVVAGRGDVASVHFAFRLQDSNLPLLAAFPQLLRRAFVHCHGAGVAPRVLGAAPAAGEQELHDAASGDDRPLPPFAEPDHDVTAWCLLAALLLLALRTSVR